MKVLLLVLSLVTAKKTSSMQRHYMAHTVRTERGKVTQPLKDASWNFIDLELVYLNGNNAADGENNIKYASSYPMN